MELNYDLRMPVYLQIMESIKLKILAGEWASGSRVASVRDLAVQFRVNPNTMQRALTELERNGLLYSERTSGRFITEDAALMEREREAMATANILAFLTSMQALGYTRKQIEEKVISEVSAYE